MNLKNVIKKIWKKVIGILIIGSLAVYGLTRLIERYGVAFSVMFLLVVWACGVAAMVFWDIFFAEKKENENENN